MATLAPTRDHAVGQDRFYLVLVATMALVLVAGFSFNVAMGRSSFTSPIVWHLHAVVFFGWVALVVTQTWLGTSGPIAVHRRLGWLSLAWLPAMTLMGLGVMLGTLRRGTTPFFFMPQHFLVINTIGLLVAIGIVVAALHMRRRTDWHQRLHICGFAALLGPGFGRLLPMPLLVPYAFEASVVAGLLFPAYAMLRERRRTGTVHPAWWWGVAPIAAALLLGNVLAPTALGAAFYEAAVAGSPGAALPGMAYGPLPPGM